jgi:hypothetical protein
MVAIGAASTPMLTSVPRLWPGETVVCLASGPSLTQADVDACRGRARVIAIKDAIRLAPWADALYACDARWWKHHAQALTYTGPRFALEAKAQEWAQVLENTGELGLEVQPTGLRTGKNSGYQAINVAVHFGARRIVLLGYDMQPDRNQHHWFGKHPYSHVTPPYDVFLRCFPSIVGPLRAMGVEVINATRSTALTCFPQRSLEDALAEVAA